MINCNDTCTNNDFEESKTPEESFKRKRCEDFKLYVETKGPQFTSDLSAGANDKNCEKSYWTKCYSNKDNSYSRKSLKDVNILKDQKVTEKMDIMKTLGNILTEEKKSLEITY